MDVSNIFRVAAVFLSIITLCAACSSYRADYRSARSCSASARADLQLQNSCGTIGLQAENNMNQWTFDQSRQVAAIVSKPVFLNNHPILLVTHYKEDHSWAFLCGTTSQSEDLMLVSMEQAVNLDATLFEIADLAPGWTAYRDSVDGEWTRVKDDD